MSDTERELRAELAALAHRVETLQAQLDAARLHHPPTMRARMRCPVCGVARIAHARQVLDRNEGGSKKTMALNQPKWWSEKVIGELEAFVCTGCGLVEWYVKDPGSLRDVRDKLTIIDAETPSADPYR